MTKARDLANSANGAESVAAGAVDTAAIADANVTTAKIADANVTTAKIADVNVTQGKLEDQAVNEAKLQVSNAPTNGYMLTAQSGDTGGLTWAAAPTSSTTTGAVGTYALLVNKTDFTSDQSSTKAGSNFYYASARGDYRSASSPSGTWRCMGYATNYNASYSTTVWVRIS